MLFEKRSFKFWADVINTHLSKSGFKNKSLWKNPMKKRILFLFLSVTIIVFNLSCKKSPTEPDLQPGRRDYVWTVDTLFIPEGKTFPGRIWATGTDNIWAIGLAYLNAYCIWHYDGTKWFNYDPKIYIDPSAIYGFSKNDIWMGSTDGALWHYNGAQWSKFCETKIINYQSFIIEEICGNSSKNIYAVGFADSSDGKSYKGIIMHYDGKKWEQINIPVMHESFVQIFNIKGSDEYLIRSWIFNAPDISIYLLKDNKLSKIFTTTDSNLFMRSLRDKIYFTMDQKIYKYENGQVVLFKDFIGQKYSYGMWGRSEKDFFTANEDGIGHYNGTDLITIYKKENNDWMCNESIVFEKEIFSIWQDTMTGKAFVVHGKLKD